MTELRIHNGTYTISNLQTGGHRTFRLRTQKATASFKPNERLLAVLTGPNNREDYQTVGTLDDNGVHLWRRYEGTELEKLARSFWAIAVEGQYTDRYSVHAATTCVRCNRKLTTPISIETGIGPECAGRDDSTMHATARERELRLKKARKLREKLEKMGVTRE